MLVPCAMWTCLYSTWSNLLSLKQHTCLYFRSCSYHSNSTDSVYTRIHQQRRQGDHPDATLHITDKEGYAGLVRQMGWSQSPAFVLRPPTRTHQPKSKQKSVSLTKYDAKKTVCSRIYCTHVFIWLNNNFYIYMSYLYYLWQYILLNAITLLFQSM